MHPDNLTTIFISADSYEQTLLQSAIYWAEHGEHVWFISPRQFTTLPTLLKNPPNKEILKLILFIYIPEIKDFYLRLSEIHKLPKIPKAIIIMEMEYYWFPKNCEPIPTNAATITAFLMDSLSVYIKKFKEKAFLIAASAVKVDKKLETILNLYFYNKFNEDCFDEIMELFQEKYIPLTGVESVLK